MELGRVGSDFAKNGKTGLYLVRDPISDKSPGTRMMDIVFVHGLNGHCINSWKDKGAYWPQDLLPAKLPQARIMTFQYDAKVIGNMSTGGVEDTAKQLLNSLEQARIKQDANPIVFVVHSLGGIVIKQMLTTANNSSSGTQGAIGKCTKGIVFFGTPHRGSESASWATIINKISSAVLYRVDSRLVATLQSDSKDLLAISEAFRDLAKDYAIVTFYEQHIHPVTGDLIVEKSSAIMGVLHEDVLMLSGNHSSMCKFTPGDPRFNTVWWSIRKATEGPPAIRREGRRTLRLKERKGENAEIGGTATEV
ncbi:Alpha/Beta hydrolase protein [Lasiosphaeris hirsuta]|uniref:Alpha/Beta hydrolase protein n=1 Tax=Lasiosphaeris hirsuta TaxID=260670 RepID=A0AA39ZRN2_9PEZI|nr:Alpha/Beta hydrolase protein [Lasiosphaeris hirsuta]